jgi:hypothetical protein
LDSLAASALVAVLPLVVLLCLLAFFPVRAHWAALAGLAAVWVAAVLVYHMPLQMALAASVYGAFYGLLSIVWIGFPLRYHGADGAIRNRVSLHRGAFRRSAYPGAPDRLQLWGLHRGGSGLGRAGGFVAVSGAETGIEKDIPISALTGTKSSIPIW